MRLEMLLASPVPWTVLAAYVLVLWPSGWVIAAITRGWRRKIDDALPNAGLPQAGRWIGYLERLIILTLVLHGAYSAIGFLVAAKSLLRFGQLRFDQNKLQTEYILVGTLLSFAAALLLGEAVHLVAWFTEFPL